MVSIFHYIIYVHSQNTFSSACEAEKDNQARRFGAVMPAGDSLQAFDADEDKQANSRCHVMELERRKEIHSQREQQTSSGNPRPAITSNSDQKRRQRDVKWREEIEAVIREMMKE